MRLQGKVAIVTGAGQTAGEGTGNGRATAIMFAREGAKLVLANRSEASLKETRYCQVICVKFSSLSSGKFLRTFPTGLERQLNSIFNEMKANKV